MKWFWRYLLSLTSVVLGLYSIASPTTLAQENIPVEDTEFIDAIKTIPSSTPTTEDVTTSTIPVAETPEISDSGIPAETATPEAATPEAATPEVAAPANATPVPLAASEAEPLAQVTSVSQLSDVQPTDWAFQALQSLVERYGVIAGYPDGTFRGNRSLSRYEFAAGVNAALDRIQELIAAGTTDLIRKEDLATLQRLQEEFASELSVLRGRVDTLEARTAELEANQFSTTTKLHGEAIVGLVSVLGGDRADGQPAEQIPTLGTRVRLNLDTSFTGQDLLTTRLQANNIEPLGGTTPGTRGTGLILNEGSGPLLTNEGRVEFDGDSDNEFILGLLRYRFPVGPRTNVYLAGTGNGFVDLDASSQLNPYFDGGAVSLFGLRNPIYNYSGGAGFGLRHLFNDNLELNLGYLVPTADKPAEKNGLFDGQYGALAQLIVSPSDRARIGFTYINSYAPGFSPAFGTSTGSNLSNSTFGRPVSVDSYGISGTFTLSRNFALGGWVGYSNQRYIGTGKSDVWNWAVTLAFPDLGKEGNLGGILIGMEPKVTAISNNINGGQPDRDTSLHLETFYKYRFNDNITVTPGIIWLTAPNHNAENDDVFVGVVRTVFQF